MKFIYALAAASLSGDDHIKVMLVEPGWLNKLKLRSIGTHLVLLPILQVMQCLSRESWSDGVIIFQRLPQLQYFLYDLPALSAR